MMNRRIVHLVRHPCGHVASVLRGITKGKMSPEAAYRDIFEELALRPQCKAAA